MPSQISRASPGHVLLGAPWDSQKEADWVQRPSPTNTSEPAAQGREGLLRRARNTLWGRFSWSMLPLAGPEAHSLCLSLSPSQPPSLSWGLYSGALGMLGKCSTIEIDSQPWQSLRNKYSPSSYNTDNFFQPPVHPATRI